MNRYLLDTNHVSAIFKRDPRLVSRIEQEAAADFGIAMPSAGEMWFMVFNSSRIAANSTELERVLDDFRILEFDLSAACEFGRIKAELRKLGRPIPDVDVQIAAIARNNGWTLLTSDRHFSAVPDLKIEDWLKQM